MQRIFGFERSEDCPCNPVRSEWDAIIDSIATLIVLDLFTFMYDYFSDFPEKLIILKVIKNPNIFLSVKPAKT
jgi:hypothetical protein